MRLWREMNGGNRAHPSAGSGFAVVIRFGRCWDPSTGSGRTDGELAVVSARSFDTSGRAGRDGVRREGMAAGGKGRRQAASGKARRRSVGGRRGCPTASGTEGG